MVNRYLFLLLILSSVGPIGCANTWDKMTSKDFKERPFHHMFVNEDPLHTLRTRPEGGARAEAMAKLKEPIRNGGTQDEQDEVIEHILGPAATSDPSPVVRAAAIDALGRFQDERVPAILVSAFHQVAPKETKKSKTNMPNMFEGMDFGLNGPVGYPNNTVAMLQSKAMNSLSKTGSPEAWELITRVAENVEGDYDRQVRLAAIRGLTETRQREAVEVLTRVFVDEHEADVALAGRAHSALVELTGQTLPAEPQVWHEVVQAGSFEIRSQSDIEQAIYRLTGN